MERLTEFIKMFWSGFSMPKFSFLDFIEILIIAWLIYYVAKWIKNTRAWVIVKGLLVIALFWILAEVLHFDVILWILEKTIGVGITAIIILFQPELRKALENLGQRKIVPFAFLGDPRSGRDQFNEKTVDELIKGCFDLAKTRTGALIVIEQEVPLTEYEETGIEVDGVVSAALLINIFEKNTPLHDGAVTVRGNRVTAATCYLPLSDNMKLSKDLGTRHRAAVGVSEVTDAFVIIVSEETGKVSVARNGALVYNVDGDYLRTKLSELIIKKKKGGKA
ncbi:MAG: diadenylate cyclase CdaA [Lachnospiraceae bacterium]|nr:diadenylate cyclase CdaA [Lachnospiraceae bacterium]MBP5249685.1 diadenylate cyclase CdaA [Lachnospiraceae bacterium]